MIINTNRGNIMKKFIFILILMFMCVVGVKAAGEVLENPNAENKLVALTCEYDDVKINYNSEGYIINIVGDYSDHSENAFVYHINSASEELLKKRFEAYVSNDECPDMYYCAEHKQAIGEKTHNYYYDFFLDSVDAANNKFKCKGHKHIPTDCSSYLDLVIELKTTYKNNDMNEYNKLKDNLINMCSFVYEHENYGSSCVTNCLTLSDTIAELEGSKTNNAECGLGTEITAWIMNILRWVKYIIPVIIILLSILDFIKALSSEKDDEMKKAQKRFVTRLIVAVLIFLMPLLIEFILGKMGFDASNCGIDNIGF